MTELQLRLREIAQLQPLGARLVVGVISPSVYTKPGDVRRPSLTSEDQRARQRIYSQRHRERMKAKSK